MKNLGGFFELEIQEGDSLYHDSAVKLTTARACLNLVLKIKKYDKVYLPFYCCDALIQPLELKGINFTFFAINEALEIIDEIKLKQNEAIIYCNFFGIKSNYIQKLITVYKDQLIIDDTHSFFIKGYKQNISYTTARKYFGVPDGAFLYMPDEDFDYKLERNTNLSISHNLNRLLGFQEKAYQQYIDFENSLDSSIKEISVLSEKILKTLDYHKIRLKRNENFKFFFEKLKKINTLNIDDNVVDCFCYPLLLKKPIDKKLFYTENIFIPSYWLDVTKREKQNKYYFENKLSLELLPLPIDHRYSKTDLQRIINLINVHING